MQESCTWVKYRRRRIVIHNNDKLRFTQIKSSYYNIYYNYITVYFGGRRVQATYIGLKVWDLLSLAPLARGKEKRLLLNNHTSLSRLGSAASVGSQSRRNDNSDSKLASARCAGQSRRVKTLGPEHAETMSQPLVNRPRASEEGS